MAKMLITVPEMIWLVLYLIDSTPCTSPSNAPASTAPSSPIHRLLTLPTIAPIMAAVSIMPSMAMLTTPARSHRIPDSAPSVSGTAESMIRSIPARFRDAPGRRPGEEGEDEHPADQAESTSSCA